ncbi:DUF2533 family protein [Bacillus suaedae]|uniref:DUF2533 family protein n=1 Tax=Halalkalibacter suaedae TaxID=2822140 RepID=A0A940WZ33_9BACI|nr:DUF2533 family protein [Bacillus suaedae]MBP3951330.1 DUF2533 family protein [Bacillus suaedae]
MAVHLQIAEQVKNHRQAQKDFLALDAAREQAIEAVFQLAKAGKPFQTNEINQITNEMNQIATRFQFPARKQVTIEMINQFLTRN